MLEKTLKHEILYIDPRDLIAYENNSRKHDADQIERIKKSIQEFGFINPVLIEEDNTIIAGHARVQSAIALSLKEVPTIKVSHLTENQIKAYVIADNRLAELSTWDDDILNKELEWLDSNDFDITLTGFDDFHIELDPLEEDEDSIIEPPEDPISKIGDVWIMGKHRVMCGSSTIQTDIEKLMMGVKADLWLTDPPYNVNYKGGTKDALTILNDSMEDSNFRQFLVDAYSTADTVMKSGAAFYIWHADLEGYNFRGAAKDIGWDVRQCLIWRKNQFVMGRQDYHWAHEPCLYGWKSGSKHNWYADRKQSTILEFNKPQRNGEHPTMKPVDLFEYQIANSTRVNDVVLDSFGGSGTTLIACEQTSRTARLMELDPKYVDVIINRWQTLTGKDAILESTGEKYNDLKK